MMRDRLYQNGVMPIHVGASLLCAVLLLVAWVFGFGPLLLDTQQATSVLEQAQQAEYEATQVNSTLERLSKELAELKTQLDEQPVQLQSASRINPLLAELARWSELHGLSITRTRAGRPESLPYYDYVPVEIAGEGSYRDLLAFFRRLYNERGDLGLVKFRVARMAAGVDVSFELDLAWYVLRDEPDPNPNNPAQATASVRTE